MFYEAVASDDTRSISMAVSKNGLKDWARLGRPILEAGQPGSWDAGGVCSPSAVSMAGQTLFQQAYQAMLVDGGPTFRLALCTKQRSSDREIGSCGKKALPRLDISSLCCHCSAGNGLYGGLAIGQVL